MKQTVRRLLLVAIIGAAVGVGATSATASTQGAAASAELAAECNTANPTWEVTRASAGAQTLRACAGRSASESMREKLPQTGQSTAAKAGFAIALTALGVGLFLLARNRRTTIFTA